LGSLDKRIAIATVVVWHFIMCSVYSPKVFASSNSFTLQATVAPTIIIVADKSQEIKEIVSNTCSFVTSTERIGSIRGPSVAVTPEIYSQFLTIIHGGKLVSPGIIFDSQRTYSEMASSRPNRSHFVIKLYFITKITTSLGNISYRLLRNFDNCLGFIRNKPY